MAKLKVTLVKSPIGAIPKQRATIEAMGEKGILENKFRPEGTLSDRVLALPLLTIPRNVQTHGTLRLYCIRVSERLLVIGSGDIKRV